MDVADFWDLHMKMTSSQRDKFVRRCKAAFASEQLEARTLFSAPPVVSITASVPTASGITGADGQFEVARSGSTALPLKVYYTAASGTTINSHQYTKLTGEVTIHGGETHSYIDVKPVTGLTVVTNPVLVLQLTAKKTYTARSATATVTVDENNGTVTPATQRYYLPITIAGNGFARTDEPVDNNINLTTALSALGGSGAILDSSVQVVETDSSGNVINSSVPFQFNKASDYDATNDASGDLILEMTGTTTATQTRYYRVYFDTQGTYTAPTFSSQVTVNQNATDDVGEAAISVTNSTATYFVQQGTGGISQIIDNAGNDWVGFNSNGGSAGEYRGVPNLGIPSGLHPYDPVGNFPSSDAQGTATTTVASTGPLETTINVASTDGNVSVTYQFYAGFVRVTVNQANEENSNDNDNYWFLYEGTPGGSFSDSDSYVLSDGTSNTLNNSFDDPNGIGNSTEGQWASFQSASENRFIYFANDTASSVEDSYYDLNDQMTVFGFGRTAPTSDPSQVQELSGANSFTIGIADGNSTAAATIDGQYQSVSETVGTPALSS